MPIFWRLACLCVAVLGVAACGGGEGGGPVAAVPAVRLTGVAATGAALAGATVTARCVSGREVSGTTSGDGAFVLVLSESHTLPCMLKVTGGSPLVTLYSFAASEGRVNLTPMTDFVVARALGADTAAAFDSFDAAKGATIAAGLNAAKAYVNTQVAAFAGRTQSIDILTGIFVVGDANDQVLDALAAAMRVSGKSVTDIRAVSTVGLTVTYVAVGNLIEGWSVNFIPTGAYSAVMMPANADFRVLLESACTGTGFAFGGYWGARDFFKGAGLGQLFFGCKEGLPGSGPSLLANMLAGGLPHQAGADIVSGPVGAGSGGATVTVNQGMPGVQAGDSCTVAIDPSLSPLGMVVTVAGNPYFQQTGADGFGFRGDQNGHSIRITNTGVVSEYSMTNSAGNRLTVRPNLQLFMSGSNGAEAEVFSADGANYYVCK